MSRGAILLPGALLLGCAPMHDRVVLLPGADGRTGALVVKTAQSETVLASPYASVDVEAGGAVLARNSEAPAAESVKAAPVATLRAAEVSGRYAALLEAQPPPPHTYIVYFVSGKAELTPDSHALLERVKAAMAAMPAAEIVVTGHTDRVGLEKANDRLSLRRAHVVRDALVAIGIAPAAIAMASRGERDWAVATEDQVSESKNRRVEIKVR